MRLRTISALAIGALLAGGLTGCRTTVGTAAVIDGHRVTESEVSRYVTADSQPITENSASGGTRQIAPRSFVVAQLINERLGFKILEKIPSASSMTSAQLDAKLNRDIAGRSVKAVAEGLGLKGYPTAFYRIVLRVQELSTVIGQAQQSGLDLQKLIREIEFPVSVNPRYGKWDSKTVSFDGTTVIPSYLKVQPGAPAVAAVPTGTQ